MFKTLIILMVITSGYAAEGGAPNEHADDKAKTEKPKKDDKDRSPAKSDDELLKWAATADLSPLPLPPMPADGAGHPAEWKTYKDAESVNDCLSVLVSKRPNANNSPEHKAGYLKSLHELQSLPGYASAAKTRKWAK